MVNAQEQWERERQFFDAQAAQARAFNLDVIAKRYELAMPKPLYPLEVAYSIAGDLRGKRVLDVGCGGGENSLLFARWGASVVGVDISEGAIALAKTRARAAGLAANTTFLAMPFEAVANAQSRFDVVWSAAFLHHVLDRLEEVLAQLHANTKDDGVVIMLEPVRPSPLLRRLRSFIPPFAAGTPDERPLEGRDLEKIRHVFDVKQRKLYGPLSRVTARSLMRGAYESSGPFRRQLSDLGHKLDGVLMGVPAMAPAAMIMVASLSPKAR